MTALGILTIAYGVVLAGMIVAAIVLGRGKDSDGE